MKDFFKRLENKIIVKAHKLEHGITDEEWNERIKRQREIITTEKLTKDINFK